MRKAVYQKKILELEKPRRGAFVTTWAERRALNAINSLVGYAAVIGCIRMQRECMGDAWADEFTRPKEGIASRAAVWH